MKIIPKDTRPKKYVWKCYTLWDFAAMLGFFGIVLLFATSNLKLIPKVILSVGSLIIGGILFIPIKKELLYRDIFRLIRYLSEKKQYTKVKGDIVKIIPQIAIEENIIHYPGYVGSVLELNCINLDLQDAMEQEMTLEEFEFALRYVDALHGCDIVKIDRPLILDDQRDMLFEKIKDRLEKDDIIKANIIAARMQDVAEYNTEHIINVPHYYLVLYAQNEEALSTIVNSVSGYLDSINLLNKMLENRELVIFLKYCNCNDFEERDISSDDEFIKNRSLALDLIKPDIIEFKRDCYKVNDSYAAIMTVKDYPLEVGNGWADKIFDINDTKVVCHIKPVPTQIAEKRINNSLKELTTQTDLAKASEYLENSNHIDSLTSLLEAIKTSNQQLFDVSFTVTCYANTYKELKQTKRAVSQYIATSGLIPDNLILQQQQGYINGNISSRSALKRFERGIHSQSLAAMFPFNSPLTLDENGLVLGSNEFPVSLDIWKRGTDYQNSNAFIVGTPGGGKSYFCKLLLTQLYSDNTHILIIDPENEYEILCANLGGSYLDVGNASTGIFNPFHIYASLSDDGSISDSRETLSAHLRMLESFFKIILEGAGSETLETINNAVTMLYKKKNLVDIDSYDNIPADKFPIFDDLYKELLNQEKTTTSEILKVQFQRAIMYIQKFVGEGRYSKIWNGYSSINTKSDFIVFNFKTLFSNKNTLVANAQMLLVLRYIEQQVINKRADIDVEHVAVIADEAHLFIDPKFPIALDFFYQMIKRIRKYKGSFIPITQAISDWTATPEVANKTTAILKEAQYNFIFKLKPNSAEDLARLFVAGGGLNDTELHSIIKAGTGDMFFIGNETLHTRFHVIANPYIRMLFEKRNVPENYFEEHFEYLKDLIQKGWRPGMKDPNDTSETEDTPEGNGTEEIGSEEVEKENNDNINPGMKTNRAKLFFRNLVGKIKKVFKKK